MSGKTCPGCRKTLPVESFGIDRYRKSGLNNYCKACVNARRQAARESIKRENRKRSDAEIYARARAASEDA